MIDYAAFSDELVKISQANREINKEEFKQFLKNTGVIAAGAGLGVGLGHLTVQGLKRFGGPRSSAVRGALMVGLPVASGLGAMALKARADKEKSRLLDEAYQRGLGTGRAKTARDERQFSLRDGGIVAGATASGAGLASGGRYGSEKLVHGLQIAKAQAKGAKSVNLRFLRGRGYIPYVVGGGLVGGGLATAAIGRRIQKARRRG